MWDIVLRGMLSLTYRRVLLRDGNAMEYEEECATRGTSSVATVALGRVDKCEGDGQCSCCRLSHDYSVAWEVQLSQVVTRLAGKPFFSGRRTACTASSAPTRREDHKAGEWQLAVLIHSSPTVSRSPQLVCMSPLSDCWAKPRSLQ